MINNNEVYEQILKNPFVSHFNRMKVRITTFEDILGTSPDDKEIYDKFIASKDENSTPEKKAEELDGIPDDVDPKGKTIFPKFEDGKPYYYDYQIKGYFKDSCSMLSKAAEKDEKGKKKSSLKSPKLTAYKKVIDGNIFVFPRRIPIEYEGEIGSCQRPLRAQTAQGERIALANSESIPAPASFEFEVLYMRPDLKDVIIEWLDYGILRGLGQWRNSGMGRFTYEIIDETVAKSK